MKEIQASEFKAKCLAILDEVAQQGESVTILKRGKPVAQLIPPTSRLHRFPQHELMGTVSILGDVISPTLPAQEWESEGHLPR
ncbi:MAG: antitoxin [Nitrospirales bacterium]|nr:MAG: antitoxin [Nitrospirales bacterium]